MKEFRISECIHFQWGTVEMHLKIAMNIIKMGVRISEGPLYSLSCSYLHNKETYAEQEPNIEVLLSSLHADQLRLHVL